MIRRTAASRLAAALERNGTRPFALAAVSSLWKRVANPVRPVTLPRRASVIGVGGPTLGGSYKTPFVLALALALAERGRSVAVVAHGYRARISTARRVRRSDDVREVGDDASCLERALSDVGVPVVVGPRDEAVSLAATEASIVIIDGLLQASPHRLDWSILVTDADAPWGSGWCPPAGDLRASKRVLLSAADDISIVVDAASSRDEPLPAFGTDAFRVESRLEAVRGPGDDVISLDALRGSRVGFLAAIARPERVLRGLAHRGIEPVDVRLFRDHAPLAENFRSWREPADVDMWVTTKKCRTKLGPTYEGEPVCVLDHQLLLPPELVRRAENRQAG